MFFEASLQFLCEINVLFITLVVRCRKSELNVEEFIFLPSACPFCFGKVSSLLSFVCFCSLFLISVLSFLPSHWDVSSRLDCFLLISSPWVVFVRAVRTEVETSDSPLSFGCFLTPHRSGLCVSGSIEAVCCLLKKWRSEESFISSTELIEMSTQSSWWGSHPGVRWGRLGVSISQRSPQVYRLDEAPRPRIDSDSTICHKQTRIYSKVRWCRRSLIHWLKVRTTLFFPSKQFESSSQ